MDSDIIMLLNEGSPETVLSAVAERVRERRLEKNLTQLELSSRSDIPISTYRKFERTGEISLKNLIKIAFALDMGTEFSSLFTKRAYSSLDEVIRVKDSKQRKRASRYEK